MTESKNSTQKARILFISTAKTIGGGEVYLNNVLGILKSKYDCTVLGRPIVLNWIYEHATVHRIILFPFWLEKLLRRSYRIKKFYYRVYFTRYFKKHHYEIVNLQEFDGAFVEAIDFKPLVLTEQTRLVIPDNRKTWASTLFQKIDTAICVSQQTKDDIVELGVPAAKCIVIHSGVDTSKFQLSSEEGGFVTWVGRLEEVDKNPMLFVEIAEAAQAQGLPYNFRLVGNGSAMKKIVSYKNHRAINNLEILGSKKPEEMLKIYQEASILCMTSKTEGLPNVALEAMASGRPVVSSNVGGLREIINNPMVGRLVDSFEKNDFLKDIKAILEDPKLYHRMSATARKHVETSFSLSSQANQTSRVYDELLKKYYD